VITRLRRRLARALPPIARRDAQIERLWARIRRLRQAVEVSEAEIARLTESLKQQEQRNLGLRAELEQSLGNEARLRASLEARKAAEKEASFHRRIQDGRRMVLALRELDTELWHPLRRIPFKLRNYRFAASHGLGVPTVLQVWDQVEAIDLTGLPRTFVIKSDGGSGGHGVLRLERRRDVLFRTGSDETMTLGDLRAYLAEREQREDLLPPYFAEEMLSGMVGAPVDIKVYTFYGEVGHILLRRLSPDLDPHSARFRYLAPDGSDLGAVSRDLRVDPEIPAPQDLPGVIESARHLSRAVGLPFCRVDLYETDRGVVVGEVTRLPGGPQRYRRSHDVLLGELWERAQLALELDLARGRPFGVLHGDRPAPDYYPEGHVSRTGRGSWAIVRAGCEEWCSPGAQGKDGS